jgi:hypothetical protein
MVSAFKVKLPPFRARSEDTVMLSLSKARLIQEPKVPAMRVKVLREVSPVSMFRFPEKLELKDSIVRLSLPPFRDISMSLVKSVIE